MSERKTFPENMLDDTLKRVAEELDEEGFIASRLDGSRKKYRIKQAS